MFICHKHAITHIFISEALKLLFGIQWLWHKICHIIFACRSIVNNKRNKLTSSSLSSSRKTVVRYIVKLSGELHSVSKSPKYLICFITLIYQVNELYYIILVICAFLQDIVYPCKRPLCKNRLLLNKLVVLSLNQVKLMLHLINKLTCLITVLHAVLIAFSLKRTGCGLRKHSLKLSPSVIVLIKDFAYKLLYSLLVTIKAIRGCKDGITSAITVINFLNQHLLYTYKILHT